MQPNMATVLDAMQTAILSGDFKRLAALVPDLEEAEKQAVAHGVANPGAIREKAARNAVCLQAALYGVKSARRRIADIAAATQGLTTYGRNGGKATLPAASAKPRRV